MPQPDHPAPSYAAHPLDVLPPFRRWPPSMARNLCYTALWNTTVALMLSVVNFFYGVPDERFAHYWWPNLIVANLVGFLIHGMLIGLPRMLGGWPRQASPGVRLAYLSAVIGICVVVGIGLGTALVHGGSPLRYLRAALSHQVLLFAVVVALVMIILLGSGERRLRTEALLARQQAELAEAARQLAEARLRALQAQIEPHFLYNSLANVVGLIGPAPEQARHMLERFIAYLRASLDASRAERATLGSEIDLIATYLDVLQLRMGARLRYRIDVPDDLRQLPIPPLLLQPLVENAIAHGLEPKVAGGCLVLIASRARARVIIDVRDTGVGLRGDGSSRKPGGGVGLGNLRARLASLYGAAACVQLLENQDGGLTARLVLPFDETAH